MATMGIVPALDVAKEFRFRFGVIRNVVWSSSSHSRLAKKLSAHGVVVAISDGTHRECDAGIAAAVPERQGSVLAALIGVVDHALGSPLGNRHLPER